VVNHLRNRLHRRKYSFWVIHGGVKARQLRLVILTLGGAYSTLQAIAYLEEVFNGGSKEALDGRIPVRCCCHDLQRSGICSD
jgi:hypothetical protein